MRAVPEHIELSTTDPGTGLLSAPYFRYVLREELLPAAARDESSLTVFLLDIDEFASINERYGHEIGDEVIREVVATLRDVMPEEALLARYGGDELSGMLPGVRLDDAFSLLEEVRRRIQQLNLSNPELRVTVSAGIATYPTNGEDEPVLLRAADEALYQAKRSGRNKVSLPLSDGRMVTKTSHFTATQLDRLAQLAKSLKRNEASLLREGLDDVLRKYNDRK
jgi:diguanylate cyclase (GGDEF)-like protein